MPSAPRWWADLHQVLDRLPVPSGKPRRRAHRSRNRLPPTRGVGRPAAARHGLHERPDTIGSARRSQLLPRNAEPRTIDGPSHRSARRIAFVFARRQDRRVPLPRHAGRRFPAVEGSLDPVNRADAQAGHLGPGPRRDVCTCVALVPNRSTVESENRPTVVVEFYLYARFQDRSKR